MNKEKGMNVSADVLKALREASGYSVEEIAKKLKTSPEKIKAVEEGRSLFTLTQIKKLADIYRRPLVAFFSSYIPELPKSSDYRINREKKLTPGVYLAQRRAYYLSEKIKELSGKRSQIPTFSDKLKAEDLAREFRKTLNIEIIKHRKADKILAYYKQALEDALMILIIEYPLKADDVRAFSIYADISSIVLNEDDKPSVKLFSLFHEVCHLLKRKAGICSIEIEQKENEDIESYCNQFAAEFLVPLSDLKNEIEKIKEMNEGIIAHLSEIYGVSKQVIMLRLLRLGYINQKRYEKFKETIGQTLKQKKYGYRNWDRIFFNRAGNLSIQEIKRAYEKGEITFYEALSILDLKRKYVEKFIAT